MRCKLATLGSALALTLLAAVSFAHAVAISPATITEKNVLRGTELVRSLTIFNTGKADEVFRLTSKKKPLSEWISVHDSESGSAITTVGVPAQGSSNVTVRLVVPRTAANGRYRGTLDAVPSSKPASGTLILVPSLLIDIGVVDHEIIELDLNTLVVNDAEAGTPLDINVVARNESNVDLAPTLEFGVVQGDRVIRQAEFPMDQVPAGMTGSNLFNLGIKGLKEGTYRAFGAIIYKGESSDRIWTDFEVVPPGTFTKAAMERFRISGPRVVGGTVKVGARFSSKSPKQLQPRFVADVFLDGLKIGTLESKRTKIGPYEEADFTTPFKIRRSGTYRIEGYFVYSGKESNHRSDSFNARGYEVVAYGFAGLVACVAGARYFRRWRYAKRTAV